MLDLLKLVESYGDDCPKQLKVMVYVLCHANEAGYIIGSYKKIAKAVGVSVNTVIDTMKLMIEKGLIIRVDKAICQLNPKYSERITYAELCAMPDEEAAKYYITPIL